MLANAFAVAMTVLGTLAVSGQTQEVVVQVALDRTEVEMGRCVQANVTTRTPDGRPIGGCLVLAHVNGDSADPKLLSASNVRAGRACRCAGRVSAAIMRTRRYSARDEACPQRNGNRSRPAGLGRKGTGTFFGLRVLWKISPNRAGK